MKCKSIRFFPPQRNIRESSTPLAPKLLNNILDIKNIYNYFLKEFSVYAAGLYYGSFGLVFHACMCPLKQSLPSKLHYTFTFNYSKGCAMGVWISLLPITPANSRRVWWGTMERFLLNARQKVTWPACQKNTKLDYMIIPWPARQQN